MRRAARPAAASITRRGGLTATGARAYGAAMRTLRTAPLPALLLPLLSLLLAAPTEAEEVLDQFHEGAGGTPAAVSFFQGLDRAQTFTVGVDGRLLRAELMLSRTPPPGPPVVDVVDLELRATDLDGRPAGPPIALASSVSTDELSPQPAWIEFAFASAGIPVAAGERLALVVRAPFLAFPDGASWAGTLGGAHPGGAGYTGDGGSFQPIPGDFDGNFRTWVRAPEPGAAATGASAAAALAGLRRARSRA